MKFYCVRCGYEWYARPSRWKYDSPKRCPKCWSRGLTEPLDDDDTASPKEAEV